MRLDRVNYSYALRLFNEFREKLRDTQGSLKILRIKLTQETSKILGFDDYDRLLQEVSQIKKEYEWLSSRAMPVDSSIQELTYTRQQRLSSFEQLKSRYLRLMQRRMGSDFAKPESLRKLQLRLHGAIAISQTTVSNYSTELEKIKSKIELARKIEKNNLTALSNRLMEAIRERNKLSVSLLDVELDSQANVENLLDIFSAIKSSVFLALQELPVNPNGKYGSRSLGEIKEALNRLRVIQTDLNDRLGRIQHALNHAAEHATVSDVTCPECQYSFKFSSSREQVERDEKDKSSLVVSLSEIAKKIQEHERFQDECSDYINKYLVVARLFKNHSELGPYWDFVKADGFLFEDPSVCSERLESVQKDLQTRHAITQLDAECQEKSKILQELSCSELPANTAELYEDLERITSEIEKHTTKLVKLERRKDEVSQSMQTILAIEKHRVELQKCVDSLNEVQDDLLESTRRTILNGVIREVRMLLASKEAVIHQSEKQKSIISSLTQHIADLELQEKAWLANVRAISPNEGLIAAGLFGFIEHFLDGMNDFIGKVWKYPMKIRPCAMSDPNDIELDYMFPVERGAEMDVIDDVSHCSKGMGEIFNLAFKITAMRELGFSDTILTLDEVGRNLDNGHREEFGALATELANQGEFSQVWLVSHDYLQYSGISDIEYAVLCPLNILMPDTYNQHVEIT
jgi:uncharacterized Zn finger protein (UPF0148 family)